MKKVLKQTLSVLICAIMVFGVTAAGLSSFGSVTAKAETETETSYAVGDTLYYGSYPQSRVTDTNLLSELDSKSKSWTSYGYYSGTDTAFDGQMTAKDYMNYADVYYGGNKYRAVTFSAYRPFKTSYTSSADNSLQDNNTYILGTEETPNIFWFKFEPLKWRVLDPSAGLVLSESIIDSQAYNNYILWNDLDNDSGLDAYEFFGDSSQTHYASDYANSSIREWLNKDFFNAAFSEMQQSNIATTELNNHGYHTLNGTTGYEKLDSDSTDDKIFLLSYTEAQNETYDLDTSDKQVATGTDYAKCQGLWKYGSNGSGNSEWRLRSPGHDSGSTCVVKYDGGVYYHYGTYNASGGVRPAFKMLNLKSYTLSYNLNGADGTTVPVAVTANYGTAVTVTADIPTKEGCTFKGWSQNKNAVSADDFGDNNMIELDKDVTLYAVWSTNEYTITFNTDGGNDIAPITQAYNTAVNAPENPTKTGYSFAGWDATIPSTMPAENVTYTAMWTINEYTITFNTDGGNDIAPITQAYNTAVTKPENPTKINNIFAGWSRAIPTTMPGENITITAKWSKITLSLTERYLTLCYNRTAQLHATADGGTVVYTSSDPKVATVDENGIVTAKYPGTCTVTATVDGTDISQSAEINVKFTFWDWIKYVFDTIATWFK